MWRIWLEKGHCTLRELEEEWSLENLLKAHQALNAKAALEELAIKRAKEDTKGNQ